MGEDLIPFEMAGGGGHDDRADAFAYAAGARGWEIHKILDNMLHERHTLWYRHQGMGLDPINTILLHWTPGSRLAQECRRFTPGQSGHSEAMAARLDEIAKNLRRGQPVTEAKEALLWLCAAETERRREDPSTVDAQAHEVVDVQALGPA